MSSPRSIPRQRETERGWQRTVIECAGWMRWEISFTWLSVHSPAGFPDLRLCRPPRLIFAELKTDRGKLSKSQEKWRDLLAQVPGVEFYTWRPSDWPDVERILR